MGELRYALNILAAVLFVMGGGTLLWVVFNDPTGGHWEAISWALLLLSGAVQVYKYIKDGNNPLKTKYPTPENTYRILFYGLLIMLIILIFSIYSSGEIDEIVERLQKPIYSL
jgi:hypothetical protein